VCEDTKINKANCYARSTDYWQVEDQPYIGIGKDLSGWLERVRPNKRKVSLNCRNSKKRKNKQKNKSVSLNLSTSHVVVTETISNVEREMKIILLFLFFVS
jgi:hypothetical protein